MLGQRGMVRVVDWLSVADVDAVFGRKDVLSAGIVHCSGEAVMGMESRKLHDIVKSKERGGSRAASRRRVGCWVRRVAWKSEPKGSGDGSV